MSESSTVPVVLTAAGRQTQSIAALVSQYLAIATNLAPGLTANLPASLVEDMSSTAAAAVSEMDQFVTELINSMTPYGANVFVLNQLGTQAGIPQGTVTNGNRVGTRCRGAGAKRYAVLRMG